MRIIELLISNGRGGAETTIYDFVEYLIQKNIDVKLLLNDEIFKYFENLGTSHIINLGLYYSINRTFCRINNRMPALIRNLKFLKFEKIKERKFLKNLKNTIIEMKPDILHIHLPTALKLFTQMAIKFDFPVIFTIRGNMELEKPFLNSKSKRNRKLILLGLSKVDYITSECKYFIEILKKIKLNIINSKKLILIPKGINLKKIEIIDPFKFNNNCFKLLYIGGVRYFKGWDILLKALPIIKKQISNFKLYILRPIPKNHIFRTYIKKKNLEQNVKFLGFVDYHKYIQLMKYVDVGILPSRSEGIAPSIIEFMACGTPVIATNVGGTSEIIKNNKNGLLVDPNPRSIAKAVINLYYNKELRSKLINNAKKDVKLFSFNNLEKFLDFFHKILKNKNRTSF
ncbi:MAG: glycosyltransferase family 4 protein [Promethearchaeota archaeon]